jgi:hypothetical protein
VLGDGELAVGVLVVSVLGAGELAVGVLVVSVLGAGVVLVGVLVVSVLVGCVPVVVVPSLELVEVVAVSALAADIGPPRPIAVRPLPATAESSMRQTQRRARGRSLSGRSLSPSARVRSRRERLIGCLPQGSLSCASLKAHSRAFPLLMVGRRRDRPTIAGYAACD